jgi:glycosyltransferase involved in cell wall biosynthesis
MEPARLRILHTNFHRGWGGQPSRILMLSRSLVESGHEVVIAAPAGSMLAEKASRWGLETFEEPRFRKSKHLASAMRDASCLHRLLQRRQFDLMDSHGSQDLWAAAAALKLGRHALPLIYTRHNTKQVAFHPLNRFLYRNLVNHLIVVSASVLERYEPFLRHGDLHRERISVVHSSYWEERFHPGVKPASLRREMGVDGGECLLVGVVGRLVLDKGGTFFLRAVAQIAADLPAARFLFAGRGSEEEALRREAASLGLAERVRFLGFREDIPEITAALDLSVLPSVDCDASSAVLKEAMALGKPVVATDIGGAREIVEHGRTGLIVPPGDSDALAHAIKQILQQEDRGRAMGKAGQLRVKSEFSIRRMAEGTLLAYRRALESFGGIPGPHRRSS